MQRHALGTSRTADRFLGTQTELAEDTCACILHFPLCTGCSGCQAPHCNFHVMTAHTSGASRAIPAIDGKQYRRLHTDKVPYRSSSPYVCSHRLSLSEEFVCRLASCGAWAPPGEACCTWHSASAPQRSEYLHFLVPCVMLVQVYLLRVSS